LAQRVAWRRLGEPLNPIFTSEDHQGQDGTGVSNRFAILGICVAVLVQVKGWARSFQPVMNAQILAFISATDR
jgi:hypothetical protein